MRDENDPGRVYLSAVFESEEKARVREKDPRREEGLQGNRHCCVDPGVGRESEDDDLSFLRALVRASFSVQW